MVLPAYDQCIKASHLFNLLDARGVISVTERQAYILRIRESVEGLRPGVAPDGGRRWRNAIRRAGKRLMPELLVELLSEEIPARMQERASEDLLRLMVEGLAQAGLAGLGARAFATPRRLTLAIHDLPDAAPDTMEERKGPRTDAPAAAIEGFLRQAGVTLAQCIVVEDRKGSFHVARIERPGRATPEIVATLLPEVIRKFPWPKSMRWGSRQLRWVRPLHALLVTFDGEIVDVTVEGLRSGATTRGHRFMAPHPIKVRRFEDYELKLRDAWVMLDAAGRVATIRAEGDTLAFAKGLKVVEDEGLLKETAGLVEWPVVLMGSFEPNFLSLPPEVIITSIRSHQKCFGLREADGGLSNQYLLVIEHDRQGWRQGNRRRQ